MSSFISNFNQGLQEQVTSVRNQLEALKRTADTKTGRLQDVVNEYLVELNDKIYEQSEKFDALDEDFEEWSFEMFDEIEDRKDEQLVKRLRERAEKANKRADIAFEKALDAIDRAEREMLRSKIAHADAGISKPQPKL